MPTDLSPSDLHLLLEEADAAARRLRRSLRLPASELDDLRQDLLVDLLARLRGYDPARGSLGAFANIVLRHRAAVIAARARRERALFHDRPTEIEAVLSEGDGVTPADRMSEADSLIAFYGQRADPIAAAERRIAIGQALGRLRSGERRICLAVGATPPGRLAPALGISRATLHRRVRALRCALLAHGLQPGA